MVRSPLILLLLATSANAQTTDYRGTIATVLESAGCSLTVPEDARGRGYERWFSEKLADVSDIALEDWLDQSSPHFRGIDRAMQDMVKDNTIRLDRATFTMTLSDCD